MSQYAALVSNNRNLTVGKETKLFVSDRYANGSTPPQKQASLAGAVALAATSITISAALNVDLWEGTMLFIKTSWTGVTDYEDYADKYVIVSEFAAAGATTIPIEPALVTAASADVIKIPAWIPYFSAKTFSVTGSSNVIQDNVFSGGLDMEKAITSNDNSASSSGPLVYGDLGREECRLARKEGKRIFVLKVTPDQRGGSCFEGIPNQLDESTDETNFDQGTLNFAISGPSYKLAGLAASNL